MASSSGIRLLVSDFIISYMWVWSGVLIKIFVYNFIGLSHGPKGDAVKDAIYILNMFFFAFLGKITHGGAYNPLTVLYSVISGDFNTFLFTIGARIPAQVVGSVMGIRRLLQTLPELGRHGPRLNVHIYHGALIEGALTFAIVLISLVASRQIPGSFYRKTWIASVLKLTLQVLSSDLTGGCINPATVIGWAFARGEHLTKEHVIVYWLSPAIATQLAVWTFRLIVRQPKEEKVEKQE